MSQFFKQQGASSSPAPLRKTKRNWAIRVFILATIKQNGDIAATGDPPNVVDKDNLEQSAVNSQQSLSPPMQQFTHE